MKLAKKLLTLSIFSLLFLCSGLLYAQEKTVNRSYLTDDNEITQTFCWQGTKNVYRYEFLLEKMNENKEYEYKDLIDTEETKVDIKLGFGKYRYRIRVYNYLNYMDFETDWVPFEIIETHYPVITKVTPSLVQLDENPSGVFTVEGTGYSLNTVFTVENQFFEISAKVIDIDTQGTRARIRIDPTLLDVGTYYIRAVNPGDVFDTSGQIRVGFYKRTDFNVSAGWTSIFMMTDPTVPDSIGNFFNGDTPFNPFSPMGANIKATFIPLKTAFFYFGGGLIMDLNHKQYKATKGGHDLYTINAPFYSACATLNMQFVIINKRPRRLIADVHAGAGVFGVAGMFVDYANKPVHRDGPYATFDPCVTAGAGINLYLLNKLYVDGSCDFTWSPTHSDTGKMQAMFIKPSVGMGWQF